MFLVVWSWIGIIAGRVYILLPGAHRLHVWAFAIGLAGAWTGGWASAMLVHGNFFAMDWVTLVGSMFGAALQISVLDLIVRAIVRQQAADGRGVADARTEGVETRRRAAK